MNEIIALRRRIDDLENKLFYYEDIFENNRYLAIKDKTGLPPTQAVILDVLIRRPIVSHSVFDEIISRRSMRNDRDSFDPRNNMSVHICRLRKALKAFDVEIHNSLGVGYSIKAHDRKKLEAIFFGEVV